MHWVKEFRQQVSEQRDHLLGFFINLILTETKEINKMMNVGLDHLQGQEANVRYPRHSLSCRGLLEYFIQKIQLIVNKILQAYHEPSKYVPKLILQAHPIPNTYPQKYKKMDWPPYLDNARGASCADSNDIRNGTEPKEQVTSLHAVTLGNNEKGIFRLIADGGIIEAKDIRGQTPAYWAAYHGNLEMLMKLKIYGADLNHKDFRDKTPLRAAAKYGHVKVVEFLASHKVNLNALDGRGLTPLHIAAYHKNFSVYEKLIYFGADRSIKDPLGRTAEEILNMKYAETYHNRWFIGRLFSSSTPPALSLKSWIIAKLTESIQGKNS